MSMIRAMIVDDEPFARKKIRRLLQAQPEFEVIAECGDGETALAEVKAKKPDLVFLDIQMPGKDGLQVLRELDVEPLPQIVFVTAYDKFAIAAFELHALDYLLKPFDQQRFDKTLDRMRQKMRDQSASPNPEQFAKLVQQLEKPKDFLQRLMIKSSGQIYFVKTEDVDWIEAAGNYVTIYAKKRRHLMRQTMTSLVASLDPTNFVRIHRSQIVNIDKIKHLKSDMHGEYTIYLHDDTVLTLTRTYRENLFKRMEP